MTNIPEGATAPGANMTDDDAMQPTPAMDPAEDMKQLEEAEDVVELSEKEEAEKLGLENDSQAK